MSYNPRTTDKYTKVKKQADKAPENEIRIRAVPRIGRYISYAATLLLGDKDGAKLDSIILKASGNAAKSACQIAEILRHKIVGLHQENILKTIPVTDEYEPKEEGLDKVTVERKLAVLEIHLSLKEGVLNSKSVGYQAPLPKDQVEEEGLKQITEGKRGEGRPRQRGNRRGGRRGRYTGNRGGGRNQGNRRDDRDDDREDRRPYRDNRDNRDNYRGGERRNEGGRGGDRREGGYRGGNDNRRNDDRREGGYRGGNNNNRRNDNRSDNRSDNRNDNRSNQPRSNNNNNSNRNNRRD